MVEIMNTTNNKMELTAAIQALKTFENQKYNNTYN